MSKISTVYDGVLAALGDMYSDKRRIPNTLVLSENPEQYLRNGYGLRIDSEIPNPSEFCNFSRSRVFTVLLTREVLTTDTQTAPVDTAIKVLLEDVYTLQRDFMNPDQIEMEESIEIVRMAGTSAVLPFIGERGNFIVVEVSFQIQITDII